MTRLLTSKLDLIILTDHNDLQILYETTKRKKTDSSSSDTANATGEGSGNHGSDVEDESKEDVKDIPSEQGYDGGLVDIN